MITLVTDDIYRGPRPTADHFDQLRRLGIRSIIDLDDDEEHVTFEQKVCEEQGIFYYRMPLDEFKHPDVQGLQDITKTILMVPKPAFVHCRRGKDRTGFAIAAYRVEVQKWSFWKAYKECVRYGHSWVFYVGWVHTLVKLEDKVKGND